MKANIIHIGPGKVGSAFLKQFLDVKADIDARYSIHTSVVCVAGSTQWMYNRGGLSPANISKLDLPDTYTQDDIKSVIDQISGPTIVVDTSASDATVGLLKQAVCNGHYVVLANKKPISGSHEDFSELFGNNVFAETTVGAGLPVLSTVQELLMTGDDIVSIEGCFSGTLGYIFSELENGESFSDVVKDAKEKGFTEPDPRDDLSGIDVARKALIVSRLMGKKMEINDIHIEPLFPKRMLEDSIHNFVQELSTLDNEYARRLQKAQKKGKTLRYVAKLSQKNVSVGIQEVSTTSDIGSLSGPDNIVVLQTKRYYNNPMIIKGPGAGVDVTAAGVLGDVIKVIQRISS